MAHGAADDSNVKIQEDVYRMDDMAELAVRMGSIVNYQRSGSVLVMDGFEEGLNAWQANRTGTNSLVEVSNDMAYSGQVACKVVSGTGVTPHAGISKYLPPVTEGYSAIQTSFSLDSDVVSIEIRLTYGFSPARSYFKVRYHHPTGALQYESAPGVYTDFAYPGHLYDFAYNWHNMKLVVDLVNGVNVRCYMDNVAYSMASIPPLTGAWALGPFLYPFLRVYGDGVSAGTVYFDNVIVTYNEF